MPEGRILLKRIAQSKKLAALKTDGARLLYTWTLPHLDINGCFHGDAEILKSLIFTRLNKTTEEVAEGYLQDIEAKGLVLRYENNGDQFLIYPDFEDKQPKLQKDREAKPIIPLPTPDQLKSPSRPHPDLIPLSKVKESKVKESKRDFFGLFWKNYPKKKSKGQAEKAFAKIKPDEQLLAIMLATIEQAKKSEEWRKDNGKFIPHPATWLNAKGWEDEIVLPGLPSHAEKKKPPCDKCKERDSVGDYDDGKNYCGACWPGAGKNQAVVQEHQKNIGKEVPQLMDEVQTEARIASLRSQADLLRKDTT